MRPPRPSLFLSRRSRRTQGSILADQRIMLPHLALLLLLLLAQPAGGLLAQPAGGLRGAAGAHVARRTAPIELVASAATEAKATATAAQPSGAALPLKINDEWVDVSAWADAHPGGRWLLEYARGRDVTALFKAIHMRSESLATASLAKLPRLEASQLPLPSAPGLHPSELQAEGSLQGEYVFSLHAPPERPPLPPIDSPLRSELRELLRREFASPAASKATAAHWFRTAIAAIGTLACWAGWLHGSALACLLLPFVHWVLIAHTVHEATHGNLSTDPRVNFWLQFTSHPICFNVFVWIPQHLLSHHQYTNDYEHDADCHHFAPALLSSVQAGGTALNRQP